MLALVAGVVAAAAVGLVFSLSQRLQPDHGLLRTVSYTAVSGFIPAAVYTVLDGQHVDALLWLGTALAAGLALLFLATRDSQTPWALSYGLRGLRVWAFILLAAFAGYGLLLRYGQINPYHWAAALFGVLVGASEVVSRYRDEPGAALFSFPGMIYLAINGGIAAAAFGLLRYYEAALVPGLQGDQLLASLLAGFGAMVVMRSKLFNFKTAGGEEFSVGPDAVITIFLRSVDRAIDRWRWVSRQRLVFRSTRGVTFSQRVSDFFKGSLAAYQNLSSEEKAELGRVIDAVAGQADLDGQLKLMAMAFGFLNISGEGNYVELMDDLRTFLGQGPPGGPGPGGVPPPGGL
ncbi:MAG TPA: hypothetical protein VGF55_18345 [Gemmataceae bacterium]|jgi:hypothetical protein